ncbi:MAG TPA: Re/Si-specific NAD(P)(+) transhydrogenase subunit alpha [Vicinamibacteria bacterium]|nr:Re/Si-specific NAD(P)(+) transhydrogenase subunit alpha [Vicinamibacteria bacterium]
MIAGVPRETLKGERRVALVPGNVIQLKKMGLEVLVETGAGDAAGFHDAAYADKGAAIAADGGEVFERADIVLRVRAVAGEAAADVERLRRGQVLVGMLEPLAAPEGVAALARRGVTAFALELVPRITRAQAMDVLSSVSTVVGYKAVLLAADALPRLFPLLMTAGGTVPAARVFVIGAGVAGLQAIATARRLGAVVEAYDVRPAVKEQVESLGAKFVELPLETGDSQDQGGYAKAMDEAFYRRQRETMARVVAASDVVIATAAVPGKRAPVLVTADMVAAMRPGSVIVDLAAEQGGNCEATKAGATITHQGVTVIGPVNPGATVPTPASQMYGKNLSNFLGLLVKDGAIALNLQDEILRDSLVARDGEVVSPRVREALGLPALVTA